MRTLFVLITGLILTHASISKADDERLDSDEAEYVGPLDAAPTLLGHAILVRTSHGVDMRAYIRAYYLCMDN